MLGTLLSISNDVAFQAALEQPAARAGLSLCAVAPDALPALGAANCVVAALDERVLTSERPLAAWRSAIVSAGTPNASLVLVVRDPNASPANDALLECDDLVSLADPSDLERGLIRGRNLAEERLDRRAESSESRSRVREMLTERLNDVIFQLTPELRINYVNPAWNAHLGYAIDEQIGRPFSEFVAPEARMEIDGELAKLVSGEQTRYSTETSMTASDGSTIWMELRAMADPRSPSGGAITGILLDVSSRRETDAELRASHERYRQLALRDPLTGLSNRLVFADRLQHALEVGARRSSGVALLFADLDGFKSVNDSLGHSIGDRVLAMVANRLNEHIRPGDTLARYGGDEFAVILEDLSDPTQALQIADQLIESLRAPISIGVESVSVGLSIGITLLSGRNVTYEEAIGEADTALYQAKQVGRGQYVLYESSLEPGKSNVYRFDLRRGMQEQELNLIYLPIFDLERDVIHSIEARVRWDHPKWGRLKPDQFLRRADASELMGELAKEALSLMARDLAEWRARGLTVPQIRVALSVWQALDSDLIDLFAAAQADLGIPPSQIAIELMDGSTATERDAIKPVLDGLRALDVAIGFDNFITGTTPLGSVVEMNPAYVNLYAVGHALSDKGLNSRRVVEVARALCDDYGWELVAKDLDTPEMLAWVRSLPIRYAQGDALAPGVSADEMSARLASS